MSTHQNLNFSSSDRLVDKKELRTLVPYSSTHIDRLEKAGKFPKRVKIGTHRVAWIFGEVLAWIEKAKNQRDSGVNNNGEAS